MKTEKRGLNIKRNTKAFISCSQMIDDVYESLEDYNPSEKRKNLTNFFLTYRKDQTYFSSKPIYLLHTERYKTTIQKPKTIAPTWNNDFELSDSSYSVQIFKITLSKSKNSKT